MKRLLITGGNGYIASALKRNLAYKYNVTLLTRTDADLTDSVQTNAWFSDKRFDIVIHTAISGGSRLKPDDDTVLDNNLKMYYNLLNQHTKYHKFINIGSGAELYQRNTPYGLSKHVIRSSMLSKDNFYNIRIFAVFDENELDTRFIKANILRYMNRQPISIHSNKRMDFFYMKDLISVIEHYIDIESPLTSEFNCTYSTSVDLTTIASYINQLADYKVDVTYETSNSQPDYVGEYTPSDIPFIGLQEGISEVYQNLLCNR